MGLKQGPGIRHWPLRSVAKKCGPASRISTHGREKWGDKGKAGVANVANQSVYSATIERRTVISSGFPPKTQMELISICVGRVNQSCSPGSTVDTSAHLSVDLVCKCMRVEKQLKAVSSGFGRLGVQGRFHLQRVQAQTMLQETIPQH